MRLNNWGNMFDSVVARLGMSILVMAAALASGGVVAAMAAQAHAAHTAQAASHAVHPALWPQGKWPFKHDKSLDKRVQTLLSRMSVKDKVGQLIQADINSVTPADVRKYRLGSVLAGGDSAPGGKPFAPPAAWLKLADRYYKASMDTSAGGVAIPVLFGLDAVHGDNNVVGATLFPQHSALGAMRDPALVRKITAATAEEIRATGLNWAFAPTIAVPRDDRWGRTYEGFSENPKLVARYAAAAVEGLQGKVGTPQFLDGKHVIATAKHFLGDGSTKNGKDQGDAEISEKTLRNVANAGYPPAINAGVQTVMVSFSSWNGVKMTGNKALLTDVLKKRMEFGGLVVSDWNAQGQVRGCSNVDCPKAINAGIDMVMAPDSWKGFYTHTLAEVKSGRIPMARLNDAVARILRVKMRLGLFHAGAPSQQPVGGKFNLIGSAAHRALARRAVRESLVLLKNHHHLLPLNPKQRVLVAGVGADSIPMQSGGWTLTWQGTGTTHADFPGATSIWAGIEKQVTAAGGTATLSVDGHYQHKPDVAIVVYGEHPYAEFHGDRRNVGFDPGTDHDLKLLKRLRSQGIPVVSVFLSGRPLWVNPEINASNAFVAAWLPGSEGEGVADVLLRKRDGSIAHDFHGKLAYSWPRSAVQVPLNVGQADYHPQFAYGYGLTYASADTVGHLSETSGLSGAQGREGVYMRRGKAQPGITGQLVADNGKVMPVKTVQATTGDGSIGIKAVDHTAQEDARRITWMHGTSAAFSLISDKPIDMSRETNGNEMLVATMRVDAVPPSGAVSIGMGCGNHCAASVPVGKDLRAEAGKQWFTLGMSLKCFRHAGAHMQGIDIPFRLRGPAGMSVSIGRVELGTQAARKVACPQH